LIFEVPSETFLVSSFTTRSASSLSSFLVVDSIFDAFFA